MTAVSSLQASRNTTYDAMDKVIRAAKRRGAFAGDDRKRLDALKVRAAGIEHQLDIAARVQYGTPKFRSLGEELLSVRRAIDGPFEYTSVFRPPVKGFCTSWKWVLLYPSIALDRISSTSARNLSIPGSPLALSLSARVDSSRS